jgi:hypothetical protein
MNDDNIFIDGSANLPGCHCGDECGMPCWQRVGIAPACEACGCDALPIDPAPTETRQDVLDIARRTVTGSRQQDYGHPERNLTRIGIVWGALLDREAISAREVAVMLAGLKVVRASGRENRDDLIDGIGYLFLADEAAK